MPLSFYTNSGNSYGSAIPFQRIVEPAQLGFFLNLEQAELLRIQRYNIRGLEVLLWEALAVQA